RGHEGADRRRLEERRARRAGRGHVGEAARRRVHLPGGRPGRGAAVSAAKTKAARLRFDRAEKARERSWDSYQAKVWAYEDAARGWLVATGWAFVRSGGTS